MFSLTELMRRLARREYLLNLLSLQHLLLFVDICCQLRPLLELQDGATSHSAPVELPNNIKQFLATCIGGIESKSNIDTIVDMWNALGALIWELPPRRAPPEVLQLFLQHGTPLGIGKLLYIGFYTL
jgi:hypothetical protein